MKRWLEFLAGKLRQTSSAGNAIVGILSLFLILALVVIAYPLVIWARDSYGIHLALVAFLAWGLSTLFFANLFAAAVRVNNEHLERLKRKSKGGSG